jgi:hypothetical protein
MSHCDLLRAELPRILQVGGGRIAPVHYRKGSPIPLGVGSPTNLTADFSVVDPHYGCAVALAVAVALEVEFGEALCKRTSRALLLGASMSRMSVMAC